MIPEAVSTSISVLSTIPWSYAYFPTQRMPLPHMAPLEPSRLYISIWQSAQSEGLIKISPSEPMPKFRLLTFTAADAGSSTAS